MMDPSASDIRAQILDWANELNLDEVRFTTPDLGIDASNLIDWIARERHQPLHWLTDHGNMRYTPTTLQPNTLAVISARMHYLPAGTELIEPLKDASKAYISRYALGRDYHKVFRKRLAKLAARISKAFPHSLNRALVDSAPVMEKPLARNAGHGWMGKNTLIINKSEGSYFFLGEIFTTLDIAQANLSPENHCGECVACLKVCPTDAFHGEYDIEVKRCISYLTIENNGPIPLEFREPMGNRVFGCDDCQIICPWNKNPKTTTEDAFQPRHSLDNIDLVTLFNWSEDEFKQRTQGSPIRRAGYLNFVRNLAIGLGNADPQPLIIGALERKRGLDLSPIVNEHIDWALHRQREQRRRRRKIKRPS